MNDINKYKDVFLGSYHKSQKSSNVIYVGSLILLDWNEKNTIKSIPTIEHKT